MFHAARIDQALYAFFVRAKLWRRSAILEQIRSDPEFIYLDAFILGDNSEYIKLCKMPPFRTYGSSWAWKFSTIVALGLNLRGQIVSV